MANIKISAEAQRAGYSAYEVTFILGDTVHKEQIAGRGENDACVWMFQQLRKQPEAFCITAVRPVESTTKGK